MSEKAKFSSVATWTTVILSAPLVYFTSAVALAVACRRAATSPPDWIEWVYWPIDYAHRHWRGFYEGWEHLMKLFGAP
jgi:hypothetical protein